GQAGALTNGPVSTSELVPNDDSVRHQNGYRHPAQHETRHAAEDKFTEARASISAHHDKIRAAQLDLAQNSFRHVALASFGESGIKSMPAERLNKCRSPQPDSFGSFFDCEHLDGGAGSGRARGAAAPASVMPA